MAEFIDAKYGLTLSGNPGGVRYSAISNQKFCKSFTGSFFAPAIIAAFIAPIEVPATISNFIPCLFRALYTPHSYAPSDPPPCKMRTVSKLNFLFSF